MWARRVVPSLVLLLCDLCLDPADPCWGQPASLDGSVADAVSRRSGRDADLTGIDLLDTDVRLVRRARRPATPPAHRLTVVPLAPRLRPLLRTRAPRGRLGRRSPTAQARRHDPGEDDQPAGSAAVPLPAFRPSPPALHGLWVGPPTC